MAVAPDASDYMNWTSLQGVTLEEGLTLEQCLGADDHSVIFKAQPSGQGEPAAIVKIYRAALRTAEEQLAVWEAVKLLDHPNLIRILAAGRLTLHRQELIYVAVERPDETLEQILGERALYTDEAGELILNVCRGLEHLHAAGFVHGYLSPEQVLAVGDKIKLSIEGVRRAGSVPEIELAETTYRAPESVQANVTPEADVWCLGATLFKAMTRQESEGDSRTETTRLPAPFATIVHRCLYKNPQARCTLADIVQLYQRSLYGSAGTAAGVAAPAEPNGARPPHSVTTPIARETPRASVIASPELGTERDAGRANWKIWASLAGALVLLIVGAIWLARPKGSGQHTSTPTDARPAAPVTSAQRSPSAKPQPQPSATTGQTAATPLKPGPTSGGSASAPASAQRPVWRVVTYTFKTQADAEKKVKTINSKHPGFKAEVFSPSGAAGPFLVVIGGQMSREKAAALRQRAIRSGLPRDSYVQNYGQ